MAINPDNVSIETLADLPEGGTAQEGDLFYAERGGDPYAVSMPSVQPVENISVITVNDEFATESNSRQLAVSGTLGKIDGGAGEQLTLFADWSTVTCAQTQTLPAYNYSNGTIIGQQNGVVNFASYFNGSPEEGDTGLVWIAEDETCGLYTLTDSGSVSTPYSINRMTTADASNEFINGRKVSIEADGSIYTYMGPTNPTLNTTDLVFSTYVPDPVPVPTFDVLSGSAQMIAPANYVADFGTLVTLTLPTTAVFGDVIQITGKGAGGWRVAQNAGQSIQFNSITTTVGVGGSLASYVISDCVVLQCVSSGSLWKVIGAEGNITYV